MKIINEMTIRFDSRSSNEGFARASVAAFAAQLDPTLAELNEIKTAVSEAVTNCVVHAYQENIGKIQLQVKIAEDETIEIRIKDSGCGIADVKQAMEPLFTTAPEEERAGLGFAVMESFMDKVRVRSSVGKGTVVTMTKRLRPRLRNG